jgi:hypothetical protein
MASENHDGHDRHHAGVAQAFTTFGTGMKIERGVEAW